MNIQKSAFECRRGGLVLRGTEYRPEGKNLPVAIVSHGFMANRSSVKHYARFLAELGYAAYCFDFAGGCVMMGKSDGKTTEMSVLTEVEDLLAVVEYAKGLDYTDESSILLMGCSQGGFVSALAAARPGAGISKLALFYPALCIPDDARRGRMMFAQFDPENVPEIIQCGPMKLGKCYALDVMDMDPFEEIRLFDGEVLIVHGTADKIVDLRYAERAAGVYQSRPSGRGAEYLAIDGGAHAFSKAHDRIAMERLGRFAKK